MGIPELFLEHRKGGKVQKYLRVSPNRQMFVIGSSREADLRLLGDETSEINGCHAVLRFRAPHWYLCDVSGRDTLKVNNEVVSEARINSMDKVEIAGHRLQLFVKDREADLFNESKSEGQLGLHQVVVRVRNRIVETRVLQAGEAFVWSDGENEHRLPAPANGNWLRTEYGNKVIQQRLVSAQEMTLNDGIEFDRNLRAAVLLAAAFFLFLMTTISVINLMTKNQRPEIALDQKSVDIIFNAKAIKKKMVEAQKIIKVAKGRSGGTTESPAVNNTATSSLPDESMAPKASTKPSAALTSLRKSGLGNLIGKIAKRANKQGIMVAAVGVSPDIANSGRALFSTGSTTTGGGGSAAKEGPSYRLGGIATKGKAGGVGNFKDGTALSGGSVGAGNVMALSDDEETSIEGGLDKDVIADVIKRNIGQIRYCYERQLSSNPDLYGKLVVKFTIGASGDVGEPRVDSTTLKSAMVEGCVMRRLSSWKFPLPKGGTQVHVSYPFLFKALD